MKQIVLILMSLLTFSNPSKAQKQTADTDKTDCGTGSVVTHDVEPNTLVAGNPAKLIRRI